MPSVERQNKRKKPIGESVFYPTRLPSTSNRSSPAPTINGSSYPHPNPALIDMVQEHARKSPRLSSGAEITTRSRPHSSAASRKSTPRRYTPPVSRPPTRQSDSPGLMPAPHPSLPPVLADSVMRNRPWYLPHPDLPPVSPEHWTRVWAAEAAGEYSDLPIEPFAGANEYPFPSQPLQSTQLSRASSVNDNGRVPTAERIGAFSSLSISSLADTASPPSDTEGIQPGQFDSPLTDAQLETPYTNAHPSIIPSSLDWSAEQIRLGRSPVKSRLTSRRDALPSAGPRPPPRHMWEAATRTNAQQEYQSHITPPQVYSSQRAPSAISRRHSEGTALLPVDEQDGRKHPSTSAPTVGANGIPHIATAPRLGFFSLPLIDTSPIFAPNYTFPARSSANANGAEDRLEDALQLTIDDRAPFRRPMPTVEQSIENYDIDPLSPSALDDAWSESFAAYTFGSDAHSAAPSRAPEESPFISPFVSPSSSTVIEPVPTELSELLTEYELQTEALQRAHEQGVPSETIAATRFSREDIDKMTICSAPPPSPQPSNTTTSSRAATEPAIAYFPFRTLSTTTSSAKSDPVTGSEEAVDQTVCTKALKYLANNELHPEFAAKYRVKEILGAGGYGFVCVGVMTGAGNIAGTEVAVKFLFKHRNGRERRSIPMAGSQPLESFVLQQLDHPGIIRCLDVFEDDEMFYMVMELHGHAWEASDHEGRSRPLSKVSGPEPIRQPEPEGLVNPFARPDMPRRASHDLFEAVEHNRFTPAQAKSIFRQIVDAVAYMHERGVYHRDLKDENVVIDRYLHVKLIDFGSAAVEDPGKPPTVYVGDFKGTEVYAPPEVIYSDRYTGEGSDIWALGILLSVVLTGDPPIKEEPDRRIRPDRPRLHRKVDPLAYDLIRWCMRGDPEKRADIIDVQMHQWFFVPTEDKPTSKWRSE